MSGEKTERPTPHRRRRAREEGQVARSRDLSAALSLTAGGLLVALTVPAATRHLLDLSRRSFALDLDPAGGLWAGLKTLLLAAAPVCLGLAVVGISSNLLQVGVVLTPKVLRPDPSRLDPVEGVKRIFTFSRLGLVLRAAVALLVVSLVGLHDGEAALRSAFRAVSRSSLAWVDLLPALVGGFLGVSGLALLLPASLDWALARRRLERRLRMSRQEVRDELKNQEGDPQHKGQRRRLHREMATAPVGALATAKAVVVNPTHIAVALHYDDEMDVPRVGRRGVGDDALALRAEARRLGVPIVRDVPLARALVRIPPGEPISEELYQSVAAVLVTVARAASRLGRSP